MRRFLPLSLALLLLGASPPANPDARYETRAQIAGLFESLGVRYLPAQEIKDPGVFPEPAEESKKFTAWRWMHRRRAKKYGDKVRSRALAPVYVKWVNETVGYGLFARERLRAGTFLGEYTGVVVKTADLKDGSYSWACDEKGSPAEPGCTVAVSVDALHAGNEMRFVNHSDEPNVDPVWVAVDGAWHLVYVARWPVAKDRQLLVDYGANYWKGLGVTPMKL